MSDDYEELLRAIHNGEESAVRHLLRVKKVNWQHNDQEALYIAATLDKRNIVGLFLKELVPDFAKRKVQQMHWTSRRHLDADGVDLQQQLIDARIVSLGQTIDYATLNMHAPTLISHAVDINAQGLLRFLAERHRHTFITVGMAVSYENTSTHALRLLTEAGAPPAFVEGRLFNALVSEGKLDDVRYFLDKGINPNVTTDKTGQPLLYALTVAACDIADDAARTKMLHTLINGGADITHDAFAPLKQIGHRKPFRLLDMATLPEARELPLLAFFAFDEWTERRIPAATHNARPWLKKWIDAALVPLNHALNAEDEADTWLDRLRGIGLNSDDGFILKLSVLHKSAASLTPFLLGAGARPNTRENPALELAVMADKAHLVHIIVAMGADVYALGGTFFRRAENNRQTAVLDELHQAERICARRAEQEFSAHYATARTADDLRHTVDGETGLLRAAKAGLMEEIASKNMLSGLTLQDFTHKSVTGATVMDVLCIRQDYGALFHPAIWTHKRAEAEALWTLLPEADKVAAHGAFRELNKSFRAQDMLMHLKDKAKAFRPDLK